MYDYLTALDDVVVARGIAMDWGVAFALPPVGKAKAKSLAAYTDAYDANPYWGMISPVKVKKPSVMRASWNRQTTAPGAKRPILLHRQPVASSA